MCRLLYRYYTPPLHEVGELRTVLHIGPVESKGGMQATIHHHLKHPPVGWKTESINTHVDGSVMSKINEWRSAKKELKKRLNENPPDIAHIHTATRFSWWRKLRAIKMYKFLSKLILFSCKLFVVYKYFICIVF